MADVEEPVCLIVLSVKRLQLIIQVQNGVDEDHFVDAEEGEEIPVKKMVQGMPMPYASCFGI